MAKAGRKGVGGGQRKAGAGVGKDVEPNGAAPVNGADLEANGAAEQHQPEVSGAIVPVSPPTEVASQSAMTEALASTVAGGGSSSRVELLLQELIDLQKQQVKDTLELQKQQAIETAAKLAESGKLARRQRRQANRQANATSVAEALGVVCALLASTLLTALVIPPDAVFDSSAWVGFGGVGAACYAPDLVSCESWQSVYGVSASVSFVLVMVALLMTIEVATGRRSWLHKALVVFFTGCQFGAVAVSAAFWLSYPKGLAVFSVVCMATFIAISMALLPSVPMWLYFFFPVVGGRAQMFRKLQSEEYAGTMLSSIKMTEGSVSTLHLVVYVLLDAADGGSAAGPRPGITTASWLFGKLVRFSFDSWLRLLVLAEEEVGRHDSAVVPSLLLVAFMGDARWGHIMLTSGADPDCEYVDGANLYFPLYVAARGGHWQVVEELLRFDADPMKKDNAGGTALHAAAWGGSIEAVKALLEAGVDVCGVDNDRRTPLHWAASRGHKEVVEALLAAGADVAALDLSSRTPLHLAANVGQIEVVRMLLRAGADVDACEASSDGCADNWTPLHAAAWGGDPGVVTTLLDAGADVNAGAMTGSTTPLHEAAEQGHAEVVRVLLAAGADPDTEAGAASTPLHAAALAGNREVVKLLLAAGVSPNKSVDGSSWTPLHAAAVGGDRGTVEALLVAGADPNAQEHDGRAPLHAAAWQGSLAVVQALLTAGADVSLVDADARTALHAAAWAGNKNVAEALLSAGADVRAVDADGYTPLRLAQAGGHSRVAEAIYAAPGAEEVAAAEAARPTAAAGASTTARSALGGSRSSSSSSGGAGVSGSGGSRATGLYKPAPQRQLGMGGSAAGSKGLGSGGYLHRRPVLGGSVESRVVLRHVGVRAAQKKGPGGVAGAASMPGGQRAVRALCARQLPARPLLLGGM